MYNFFNYGAKRLRHECIAPQLSVTAERKTRQDTCDFLTGLSAKYPTYKYIFTHIYVCKQF